jgi:hypothetical protein
MRHPLETIAKTRALGVRADRADSFSFKTNDRTAGSNVATVSITVE